MSISGPQLMELAQIDLRLSSLRLTNPEDLRRLQESARSEGRIRDPVLVSTGVEPGYWVLVDGFKRLRVAQAMGLTDLWVLTAPLDAAHAKAAILHCNQPREGLCKLEEAWLVRSLCEQGLAQTEVAQLLKRDEPWVSRRMKLAKGLEESLQSDVKQGLLPTSAAYNLSRLQRCNQPEVARAVRECQFSTREVTRLVRKLLRAPRHEDQAVREMVLDPWAYIDAAQVEVKSAGDGDSRLSEAGNRLRRSLLRWPNLCHQLTHQLRRADPADAPLLEPLVQDAVITGRQVVEQLESTGRSCSPSPAAQGDQAPAQGLQGPSAHI
jgi:ParB/RepB/Spo0J family partition protein